MSKKPSKKIAPRASRLSGKLVTWIADKRSKKLLHGEVERRLIDLLAEVAPQYLPVPEPQGLAGGRNDLMLFEFNRRKILFEIFGTKSQVSRDLRILDKTKADVKIAVIVDREVDESVFEQFVRENPEDNYAFIFIGELYEGKLVPRTRLKLLELITGEEDAKFLRMLLEKTTSPNLHKTLRAEGIDVITEEDVKSNKVTFKQIFITTVLTRLRDLGIDDLHLRKVLRWLSNSEMLGFVLMKLKVGFNMYLYTDLKETMAVYSDRELLDWIFAGYEFEEARIVLSLNSVIYEVIDKFFKDVDDFKFDRQIRFTFNYAQMVSEPDGRTVLVSLPRNTKSIHIFRPMKPHSERAEEVSPEDYKKMIEIH